MRIKFERWGGFTGMHVASSIDSDELPVEEAYELFKMVVKSHFFDLPNHVVASNGHRDQFHCKLTVEHGKQAHTVETGDVTAPEELKPLIEHMSKQARTPQKR